MLFDDPLFHIKKLSEDFNDFRSQLMRLGLEYFRKYYGPYRAIVESNEDPAGLGRVIVNCPRARLLKDNNIWIFPMMSGAGAGHGEFFPPEKDDAVWVFFDNGDPAVPACYLGGWYHGSDVDSEIAPEASKKPVKRGWVTAGGNKIYFDDTEGSEMIVITRKNGMRIKIVDDKISVGKKDGAFEPMLLGKQVKNYIDNHTHPHAYGPTDKPTNPLPDDALSNDTETT